MTNRLDRFRYNSGSSQHNMLFRDLNRFLSRCIETGFYSTHSKLKRAHPNHYTFDSFPQIKPYPEQLQKGKLIQQSNKPNVLTFSFLPSHFCFLLLRNCQIKKCAAGAAHRKTHSSAVAKQVACSNRKHVKQSLCFCKNKNTCFRSKKILTCLAIPFYHIIKPFATIY